MKTISKSRPIILLTLICFLNTILASPYLSLGARAQEPSSSSASLSVSETVKQKFEVDVDAANPDVNLALSDTDLQRLHQEKPSHEVPTSERVQSVVTTFILLPVGIVLMVPLTPVLLVMVATDSLESDASDYLQDGKEYEAAGNLKDALAEYQRAYLEDNQSLEAYWRSGVLHQRRDESYRAAEDFTQVLRLDDGHDSAHYRRAQVWLNIDRPDRARQDFQKIDHFEDPVTRRALQEKIRTAERYYRPLTSREASIDEQLSQPERVALKNLADSTIVQCDVSLDTETKTDTAPQEESVGLGRALLGIVLIPVGIAALPLTLLFLMGMSAWQTPAEHELHHARIDYDQGDLSGTIENMNQIIDSTEDRWDIYLSRGYLWELKQHEYRAIADYSQALEISPAVQEAYVMRGRVFDQVGNRRQALQDYTRAIETDGDTRQRAEAYGLRGSVWHDLRRYRSAASDYVRAFEVHPCVHASYVGVGRVLADAGDTGPALTNFDRALELAGRVGEPYYWKVRTLLEDNRVEEARSVFSDIPDAYKAGDRFQSLKSRMESRSDVQERPQDSDG